MTGNPESGNPKTDLAGRAETLVLCPKSNWRNCYQNGNPRIGNDEA